MKEHYLTLEEDERERKNKMQREHSRKFSEHTFAKNQDALLLVI